DPLAPQHFAPLTPAVRMSAPLVRSDPWQFPGRRVSVARYQSILKERRPATRHERPPARLVHPVWEGRQCAANRGLAPHALLRIQLLLQALLTACKGPKPGLQLRLKRRFSLVKPWNLFSCEVAP